jgi:ATP-binding cassette, subfamily F, member 3
MSLSRPYGAMIRLDKISKIYPQGEILKEVTWELKTGDRIGLVGANGAGKTTQFRIITGEVEPTTGDVIRNAGIKLAYLNQEFDLEQDISVRDELGRAFAEIHEVKEALNAVHKKMETATPAELDKLIHKMDHLQHDYEHRGGYKIDMKIDKLLPELGFSLADADRPVMSYSGGWQMRIGLGKVMLRNPDVLLLDEPTNHLDLQTVEWLEEYLKGITKPMAIISHDRQFLDRLCTKIVEVERGVSTVFLGNYSAYIEQRTQIRDAQQAAYERQQLEMEKQQRFVDRFRASATRSTQAKSREKQLEKIELVEAPESELRTLQFKFPPCIASGREVVRIKNLSHAYGDNILFLGINLFVERGDKIAFLGPNGSGKSTLLRFIMGLEQPDEGTVTFGQHNIRPQYFYQNQAEALDLDKSVLNTIADEVPLWKTEEIRGLLGKFLFSGDAVFKKVGTLSGGEKARLALAKMLTGSANVLLLDEPTNHLDIPAKETIEEALQQFEGTILLVSHDRFMISKVANKIVELHDGELKFYNGNYEYYLERKAADKEKELLAKQQEEHEAKLAAKRAKEKAKQQAKSS